MKCPICNQGNQYLSYTILCWRDFKILDNGKVSKRSRLHEGDSEGDYYLYCSHCGKIWSMGEFDLIDDKIVLNEVM